MRNIRLICVICSVVLLFACSSEDSGIKKLSAVNGSKEFFNNLLQDPRTGRIPEDEDVRNLKFMRSQLESQGVFKKSVDASPYRWRQAGPNNIGGHTNAIVVDSRDSRHVLAGAETGGLWRSTDKGESWQFRTPNEFSLTLTSIAQHPIDKDCWYYTAGELFKSDNNGISWVKNTRAIGLCLYS